MYRCCECGHLFEEGEQVVWEEMHGFKSGPFEKIEACPVCYGGFEKVYECDECGDWHSKDELYVGRFHGLCEKCLRETIDYDTFFEYCEANKADHYLEIFMMQEFFGDMDCPDNISPEFHKLMIETYKRRVALAKLMPKEEDFLASCIRFIADDDGYVGRCNYADWLNKREVK